MDYKYQQEQESLAFKEQLNTYLGHWKLFVFFGLLSLIIAFLYLRYTPVEYKVTATILIKEEKSGLLSELSAFEDLSIVESTSKEVENEIEVLKSRPLFENVVRKLNLYVTYFSKTKYSKRWVERYQVSPVRLEAPEDSLSENLPASLLITINSETSFTLQEEESDFTKSGVFGNALRTPFGVITVHTVPEFINDAIGTEVLVQIQSISDAVEDYRSRVSIGAVNKDASVISLSMNTTTREKAKAILNSLIAAYNADAIRDKNIVYENTAAFIKERLAIINTELSDIEEGVETFKTSNNLTDVTSEATLFLESSSENKKEILETNTQLRLGNFMRNYLKNNQDGLLPANLGFSDEGIVRMIEQFNTLTLTRDEVLKGTTEKNPTVISLNEKLKSLRQSLTQSLKNQQSAMRIKLKNLDTQDSKMEAKIASLPKQERQLRDIVRQQEIKETLYIYLLQKREETAISLAATIANAKTIEKAYSSKLPVKPRKRIVFLIAVLSAFLLPMAIIFVKDLIDVKVKGRKEVQSFLNIPIVAEIPKSDSKELFLIAKEDRSAMAESFRIFESNLKFLVSGIEENQSKTILITSSVTGEGKTFISTNLAITLADPEKKVVLLGLDLRSPKILEYLQQKELPGVSNYLKNEKLSIEDIIVKLAHNDYLDIIPSGVVPPNPTELLKSKRFETLMHTLKQQYDYIIIDTPPVAMVADSLLISHLVDTCIYIVRSEFTDKRLLSIVENLYQEKRFSNIAVLINDIDTNNRKYYGYGYGYGYGMHSQKKWWEFWKIQ